MGYQVPTASIIFMAVSLAAGIAIPIVLLFYFRKKYQCRVLPFFVGCAVMFLFAFVLEQMVHALFLPSGIGQKVSGNIWLYALYGGLMAALFEETGRYVAFRFVLKKYRDHDAHALMYGAGHGGFEAFVILSVGMINNLVLSMMINSGASGVLTETLSGEPLAQMEALFCTLAETPSWMFLVGTAERLMAVTIQLSFSVLVWFAVKRNGALFWLAAGLHFLVDTVTVLLSGFGLHTLLIELAVLVMTVLIAGTGLHVWNVQRAAQQEQKGSMDTEE